LTTEFVFPFGFSKHTGMFRMAARYLQFLLQKSYRFRGIMFLLTIVAFAAFFDAAAATCCNAMNPHQSMVDFVNASEGRLNTSTFYEKGVSGISSCFPPHSKRDHSYC
jgi:hypothetical protein